MKIISNNLTATGILLSVFYLSWKITGKVYVTLTGSPFMVPGVHLGDDETTLMASLSSDGSTPLSTLTSISEPSVSIVNCTVTLP